MHKIKVLSILGVSGLAAILAISFAIYSLTPARSAPNSDVVLLMCLAQLNDNPPNPPIVVYASSSSENAPLIERFSSCSQALADLVSAGFIIEDVLDAGLGEGGGSYTLVRSTGSQD